MIKKILILVLILSIVGCKNKRPHEGKFTNYYDSGKKSCEGVYKKGSKVGLWTWWHENGNKKEEGYFDNNNRGRTGKWTFWLSNGVIEKEIYYVNNFPVKYIYFNKRDNDNKDWLYSIQTEGDLEFRGYVNIANGIYSKVGNWTVYTKPWFQKGFKYATGKFKNNLLDGEWTFFNEVAFMKQQGRFHKGYLEVTLASKRFYYKWKGKRGKWTYWDDEGNLDKEEIYDKNGTLIKTIFYKDGKPIEETNDRKP